MDDRARRAVRRVSTAAPVGPALSVIERLSAPRPGVLHVLTYHRIGDPTTTPHLRPELVTASAADLDAHIRMLVRRAHPVSLDQVVAALDGAPLPRRAVLVTFDDAYEDFRDVAWPVLRRHGMPATLFVPTAYPDDPTRRYWWDRAHHAVASAPPGAVVRIHDQEVVLDGPTSRADAYAMLAGVVRSAREDEAAAVLDDVERALGTPPAPSGVLGWDAIRALADAGVSIANHTRTHPVLPNLSADRLTDEVAGGHADLVARIGRSLPVLAYPGGFYDDRVVEAVREAGVVAAFTTEEGSVDVGRSDRLRLHRLNVGRVSTPSVLRARMLPIVAKPIRWLRAR